MSDENKPAPLPPVGRKLKNIFSTLSDHGNQHLSEVETDLEQTVQLMGTAIVKLGESFMAIHAAVMKQRETIDFLMGGGTLTEEMKTTFNEAHEAINSNVSAAVTGLQFQDLTSQLIFRTVRRVTGFRDMLSDVDVTNAEKLSDTHLDEIVTLLTEINKAIEEQSKSLDKRLWKAVSQTEMSSGDVELF